MNEIIQGLECDATNGKENFCGISEKKLEAIKELSKREHQEKEELKQALIDIREICNYYGVTPEENDDATLRHILKDILQIIDKILGGK